jgi:hypothetical protein
MENLKNELVLELFKERQFSNFPKNSFKERHPKKKSSAAQYVVTEKFFLLQKN